MGAFDYICNYIKDWYPELSEPEFDEVLDYLYNAGDICCMQEMCIDNLEASVDVFVNKTWGLSKYVS
jgi:hypothetical protein